MKHPLLTEVLRALKSKPDILRKLKLFAVVGLVGFVFAGGVAVWAAVSGLKYAVTAANQAILSPAAQSQIHNVRSELQKVQFQPLNCLGKAQSLLAVQPWLEREALENLRTLKIACLQSKPAGREGRPI